MYLRKKKVGLIKREGKIGLRKLGARNGLIGNPCSSLVEGR